MYFPLRWNGKFYLIISRIELLQIWQTACTRTVGRLRGHSFNLSEGGEPQSGFGVASCRLRRPQPLPKSNKDHKSRFLRNSRSGFRAFLPVLLLRDIKKDRELAWVACARDIENRARRKNRLKYAQIYNGLHRKRDVSGH